MSCRSERMNSNKKEIEEVRQKVLAGMEGKIFDIELSSD
jgi:hypothetical protein